MDDEHNISLQHPSCTYNLLTTPVKNVTPIFSRYFDGSLVWFENETKSDGNPIILLANSMEMAMT